MDHIDGKPVSPHTYKNHGCRCDGCRAAWAKYMKPRINGWRAKKRLSSSSVQTRKK